LFLSSQETNVFYATEDNSVRDPVLRFIARRRQHNCNFKGAEHRSAYVNPCATFECVACDIQLINIGFCSSLVKHEEALLADQFGKHLHRNMGLKQFRHRRNDWNDYQQRQARKRKEFSEIIDG